jgi:hypothetical protein
VTIEEWKGIHTILSDSQLEVKCENHKITHRPRNKRNSWKVQSIRYRKDNDNFLLLEKIF